MTNLSRRRPGRLFGALVAAAALTWAGAAQAHCDSLDGPVISEARKALDTGNPNLVLGWVQKKDEAEIRRVFDKAVAVRKAGGTARELADYAFFETLVRIHRAGEGAPYTGLQPAGRIEPSVLAADKSIATGELQPVARMIADNVEHGLHKQYEAVMHTRSYDPNDVQAARAYVAAYVEYVHHVERLYNAARVGNGHAQDEAAAPAKSTAHKH